MYHLARNTVWEENNTGCGLLDFHSEIGILHNVIIQCLYTNHLVEEVEAGLASYLSE